MLDLIKLRSGTPPVASKPTFALPQIFSNSSTTQVSSPAFSKLSDLTNFHLSTGGGGGSLSATSGFVIPKLTLGLSKCEAATAAATTTLTPHELSLKKIMDLKNIRLTEQTSGDETEQNRPVVGVDVVSSKIDLSSALRTANCVPIVMAAIDSAPPFVPTYIDCEQTTAIMPTITQDCQIDVSDLLLLATTDGGHQPKRVSPFGKTLCMRYTFVDNNSDDLMKQQQRRRRRLNRVKHEFTIRHHIRPYGFQNLSPDDLVLRTLNKLK